MSQRKFGVEIEHISRLSHHEFVDELLGLQLPIDTYATGHSRCPNNCYSGWQVKTDGSITTQGDYAYAIELVSPPLSLSSLGEVRNALSIADKYGAINSSCGLHVHVHAPELYAPSGIRDNNIKRIQAEWGKIEQTIFSYMPMSRRSNSNCKTGVNVRDRYHAINLDPLFSPRRTIEFRAHSASLNFNKISAWIMFCIKFVDFLATDKELNLVDPKIVLKVQPRLIRPKHGTTFYLHRPHPSWLVESKGLLVNKTFSDLKHAWEDLREPLKLPGLDYLSDFRFPTYGNAMTEVCHALNIKGIYRSYIEDRYDRVTKKFGFFDSSQNITTLFGEDEEDFYSESDYVGEDRP